MCDRSAPFPSSALSTTDFERHGFKQNRPEFTEPELAESWSWDEDHTRLTFNLRGASTGKTASRSPPPTSNAPAALVTPKTVPEGDRAVTFVLTRSQPAFSCCWQSLEA